MVRTEGSEAAKDRFNFGFAGKAAMAVALLALLI
jgi:hypothetical protein